MSPIGDELRVRWAKSRRADETAPQSSLLRDGRQPQSSHDVPRDEPRRADGPRGKRDKQRLGAQQE